jgi:hypothetical protein
MHCRYGGPSLGLNVNTYLYLKHLTVIAKSCPAIGWRINIYFPLVKLINFTNGRHVGLAM